MEQPVEVLVGTALVIDYGINGAHCVSFSWDRSGVYMYIFLYWRKLAQVQGWRLIKMIVDLVIVE